MKESLIAFMCVTFLVAVIVFKVQEVKNIEALAYNCYFEARNSTIEDQIATAVVVMNRGKPSEEVYKAGQFSWTTEYAKPANNLALAKCQAIARMVYYNHKLFKSKNICRHYAAADAKYGERHWTNTFKRRTQIGKHNYYCN